MRSRFSRGWLAQLGGGLAVAVAMTAVLALGLTHGGAPGRPASTPPALSAAGPAEALPCVPTDPTAAASPSSAPADDCAPLPSFSPSPSPTTSATPWPTPAPPVQTPAATPVATPPPAAAWPAGWQVQHLPSAIGPLMGLTCVDAEHCWAVGEDPSGFAPAIAATTDGGATWTAEAIPQQPARLQSVFDVACLSDLRCVAAAATDPAETTSVALATTDGGATWAQHALPPAGQNGPTRLQCIAPATCYLSGADQPQGANVLDISTDAGSTWTATSAPDAVCSLRQSCTLGDIRFVDSQDGWMVGNRCPNEPACTGVIAATVDGGATWRIVDTGDAYIGDIWCGRASSSVDCIAVSASTALVSVDGGSTWTSRPAPSDLTGITCVDPLHCTAVGSTSQPWNSPGLIPQDGMLATTNDGGGTWSSQLLPTDTSTWLNRVSCVSASACWVVGGQQAKVAYAGGPPGTGPQTHALVLTTSGGRRSG